MLKRAVVVGASSGIGAALVRRLVEEGYKVAAVARRGAQLDALVAEIARERPGRAFAFTHDVTDTTSVREVFDRICTTLDGLDLIVYSAGVMPPIAEDAFDPVTDRHIVEVNVIGAMNWLNVAAERFRVQRGGTIVGIGSVAGDRGRRGQPAYCASKAALHTYLESLRNRLTQYGVTVITVKPGPVHTPMTERVEKMPLAIQADAAAHGIFEAVARGSQVAYVPVVWAPIMAVIRSIPSVVFRRMSI